LERKGRLLYGAIRNQRVRRILVLGRSHIGDCLLTTPAIRALRRRFPDSRLDVAIPEANEDLLKANPYVDSIVFRPGRWDWPSKLRFALEVRQREYDLVVSFQEKSVFYGWVAGVSGAPRRIGLEHRRTRRYFTDAIPIRRGVHEVDKYLAVARRLGCAIDGRSLDLVTPVHARRSVTELLGREGIHGDPRFVGISPGATTSNKRWPASRFGEAAAVLIEALGLPALVLGGPHDIEIAEAIAQRMPRRPIVVAGKTSLGEAAALLERCRLLLTNDTGPMHMAAALAVPVVAIWGPTSTMKFRPWSSLSTIVRCEHPCPHCEQPCVHAVTVDQVVAAALEQDAGRAATPRAREVGRAHEPSIQA
jgi:heptosyltransferase-2